MHSALREGSPEQAGGLLERCGLPVGSGEPGPFRPAALLEACAPRVSAQLAIEKPTTRHATARATWPRSRMEAAALFHEEKVVRQPQKPVVRPA